MADLVVTVPKGIWFDWIYEGDAAGESATGEEWGFFLGGARPDAVRGDRLYIVAHGRLCGFAPITRVLQTERGWAICRNHAAVAVTIGKEVPGFRGWRRRWWPRDIEVPFPDWKHADVNPTNIDDRYKLERLRRGADADA